MVLEKMKMILHFKIVDRVEGCLESNNYNRETMYVLPSNCHLSKVENQITIMNYNTKSIMTKICTI